MIYLSDIFTKVYIAVFYSVRAIAWYIANAKCFSQSLHLALVLPKSFSDSL